jgi:hypothetical protein
MSNTKLGQQIAADTAAAKRGQMPTVLVDVYGRNSPKAARFGQGISDRAGAAAAADARRASKPGDYSKR